MLPHKTASSTSFNCRVLNYRQLNTISLNTILENRYFSFQLPHCNSNTLLFVNTCKRQQQQQKNIWWIKFEIKIFPFYFGWVRDVFHIICYIIYTSKWKDSYGNGGKKLYSKTLNENEKHLHAIAFFQWKQKTDFIQNEKTKKMLSIQLKLKPTCAIYYANAVFQFGFVQKFHSILLTRLRFFSSLSFFFFEAFADSFSQLSFFISSSQN